MVQQGGFEVRLAVRRPFSEPSELEYIRIAQECGDWWRRLLRVGPADDGFLVHREASTLIKERSYLALELADRPVSAQTFYFVKVRLSGSSMRISSIKCVQESLSRCTARSAAGF
jgi:hypothetical protein